MGQGTFIALLAAALLSSCFPSRSSFERDTGAEPAVPGDAADAEEDMECF